MIPFAIFGAIFGSLITWAITKYFYDRRRRAYLRENTELMKRSMETHDQFSAMHAMSYLSILRDLESGDVENAKSTSAFNAANFSNQFREEGHSH